MRQVIYGNCGDPDTRAKRKKKEGGKKKKKDSPRANTTGEIVTLMLAQGKKSH